MLAEKLDAYHQNSLGNGRFHALKQLQDRACVDLDRFKVSTVSQSFEPFASEVGGTLSRVLACVTHRKAGVVKVLVLG